MLIPIIRSKTEPTKFVSTFPTNHMLAASIFTNIDSTNWTRFFKNQLMCLCKHLMMTCSNSFDLIYQPLTKRIIQGISPGIITLTANQIIFARRARNYSTVIAQSIRAFPNIFSMLEIMLE